MGAPVGLGVDCNGSRWTDVKRTRCWWSPQLIMACVCIRGKVAEHAALPGSTSMPVAATSRRGRVALRVGFTDCGPGLAHK